MKIEVLREKDQKQQNQAKFEAVSNKAGTIFKVRNTHPPQNDPAGENSRFQTHGQELQADTGLKPDSKSVFNDKHPEINQTYFTNYTRSLLARFYPKQCPKCGGKDFKTISTREQELRCSKPGCKTHISLTSYTPVHSLRLPLWTFSFIYREALLLHPQPLTTTHIQRKLGLGRGTATTLKRRLQIFMSDLIPAVKAMMVAEIEKDFPEDFRLPDRDVDITDIISSKSAIYSDTVCLYSASQRSNGHRSRKRHNGQTSSLYLSDDYFLENQETKSYQIGTLCHTLALKGGLVLFSSVRDQTQAELQPLFDFLPHANVPHCSDSGTPWASRYNSNFRSVNHSARSINRKGKRKNVWAKNRWSKNGVHNQVAEGQNSAIKKSMRNYSWVKPKFGGMYLSEYSSLHALRLYGEHALSEARRNTCNDSKTGKSGLLGQMIYPEAPFSKPNHGYLKQAISAYLFKPFETPYERNHANFTRTKKTIPRELKDMLRLNSELFELSQACDDYYLYWSEKDSDRRKKENEYNSWAQRLFKFLKNNKENTLDLISNASSIPYSTCVKLIFRWHQLGIAEVVQVKNQKQRFNNYVVTINPLIKVLPGLLYSYSNQDQNDLSIISKPIETIVIPSEKTRRKPKYGMTKEKRKRILTGE